MLNAVRNPDHIAMTGLASSAFARHYSRNLVWFLFLRVLRCFSSPRSLRLTMYSSSDQWFFIKVVSQFGNLRIEAYLQLPAAYRSLSRPSSAPDAKAFTLCSFMLELLFCSAIYCLSFANNYFTMKKLFFLTMQLGKISFLKKGNFLNAVLTVFQVCTRLCTVCAFCFLVFPPVFQHAAKL